MAADALSSAPLPSAARQPEPTSSIPPSPPLAPTPGRRALRRWLLAMAAASVPSLLLLFLFEGSRGWMGLVFDEPGRGLYGLSDYLFTGPDWLLHAAVFAAITLIFVLLLAAAAAFDRDGRAADSLRWACRPRGIRILMGLALGCLAGGVMLPPDAAEMLGVALFLLALPLLAAAPFLSGHPATLTQPALARWWRPWWPGGRVLVPILMLWLIAVPAADWALCRMDPLGLDGGLPGALLGCLSAEAVGLTALLAMIALWFGYRRGHNFTAAMRTLLRWSVLRSLIAYRLYLACAALACGLPILLTAMYQVYALPHFVSVSLRSAASPNWAQQALLGFHLPFGDMSYILFPLIIGTILPLSFAEGRLLFVHGLGGQLGPDSPSSGAAGAGHPES